jgi:hypothetical protein
MAERIARLQALYQEAGAPGARVFRTYALRKNEHLTSTEAQEFVAQQATQQVFQARLPSDGRVSASRLGMRWMADLMDQSKRASSLRPGAAKYAMVVVDVFSREVFVEAMTQKSDTQAASAMRKILHSNEGEDPKELSVDLGREWAGPAFKELMQRKGIVVRTKDPQQVNSIAVVDRAMQSVKAILKNIQGDHGWAKSLKRAASLYNDREHSALSGESPDGVADNKVLQYKLEAENGTSVKHNNTRWRQRAGKLKDLGGFRTVLDRSTWNRIDAPRFDGKVHKVDALVGSHVVDSDGKSYPVRQVLAVPASSEDVKVPDELIPGSAKRKAQLLHLRPFSEALRTELFNRGREMSFRGVSTFLAALDGFDDTCDVYKLPKQGRVARFLRLFGFLLSGSGAGMSVQLPASSASSQPARGRPHGATDLTPRIPRAVLPAHTELTWTPDNPFRGGSAARARYEGYKSATTVGDSRTLGATSQDIRIGLTKSYGQLG